METTRRGNPGLVRGTDTRTITSASPDRVLLTSVLSSTIGQFVNLQLRHQHGSIVTTNQCDVLVTDRRFERHLPQLWRRTHGAPAPPQRASSPRRSVDTTCVQATRLRKQGRHRGVVREEGRDPRRDFDPPMGTARSVLPLTLVVGHLAILRALRHTSPSLA